VKAFADALEGGPSAGAASGLPAGTAAEPGGETAELLRAVRELAALPAPQLDEEVRTVQRAHLVAAFENLMAERGGPRVPAQRRGLHRAVALAGASRFRPRSRWGRRLAVGGLAAGMAFGTLGGVAAASSGALPGDTLYGMKRNLEDWRLGLAGTDGERGRLLLDQASTRMTEVQGLLARSGGQPLDPRLAAQIRSELEQMDTEGTKGAALLRALYLRQHGLAPMRQLASFAAQEEPALNRVSGDLPSGLAPAAEQVHRLLSGIRAEVAPLHLTGPTTSGGGPATQIPGQGYSSSAGARTPSGTPGSSAGATTSGTGTMGSGQASPGSTPGTGLLPGLGGLLGGTSGQSSGSGSGSSGSHASTGTGSTGTVTGNGSTGLNTDPSGTASSAASGSSGSLDLPPLLPGLLPGLNVSGG